MSYDSGSNYKYPKEEARTLPKPKTKEEILKSAGLQIGFKSTYDWDSILKAMDEYANQSTGTKELDRPEQKKDIKVSEGGVVLLSKIDKYIKGDITLKVLIDSFHEFENSYIDQILELCRIKRNLENALMEVQTSVIRINNSKGS